MGKGKMIYLDDELFDKLKREDNVSQLVNSLIIEHYRKHETPEEKEKRIAIIDIKIKASDKLDELEREKRRVIQEAERQLREVKDGIRV